MERVCGGGTDLLSHVCVLQVRKGAHRHSKLLQLVLSLAVGELLVREPQLDRQVAPAPPDGVDRDPKGRGVGLVAPHNDDALA